MEKTHTLSNMSQAKNSDIFLSLSLAAERSALYKTLKQHWWHVHLPNIFTPTKTEHLLLLSSKQSNSETNEHGMVFSVQ